MSLARPFQYVWAHIVGVVAFLLGRLKPSASDQAMSLGSGRGRTVVLSFADDGGVIVLDPTGLIEVKAGEGLLDALRRLLADKRPSAEDLPGFITSAPNPHGAALHRQRRRIARETGRAIVDLLADLLTSLCFLVLWALVVVIYAAFFWAAFNELHVHEWVGAPILSYEQSAGLGLLLALLANAFNGMTDALVRNAMGRLVSMLFGIDLAQAAATRRARRHRRTQRYRSRRQFP